MRCTRAFVFLLALLFYGSVAGLAYGQDQSVDNLPKNKGLRALQQGDLVTARSELESAFKSDNQDTVVILNLGETCIRQQDGRRAEQVLEKGLAIIPNSGVLNLKMGLALNLRSRFKRAQEYFTRANELLPLDHPDRSTLYINLGLAIMSDGNPIDALPWFDKSLEINPRNVTAYSYRGASLYHIGDYREAIDAFSIAIDLDNSNDITIYNRGMAYLKNGEQSQACADFHRACQLGNLNACKIIMVECAQN